MIKEVELGNYRNTKRSAFGGEELTVLQMQMQRSIIRFLTYPSYIHSVVSCLVFVLLLWNHIHICHSAQRNPYDTPMIRLVILSYE